MTKADLIESMATKLDLPKAHGRARRQHRSSTTSSARSQSGDKVNISGFGTFAGLGAQGAHRAATQDRREHRDPGVQVGQVQARQELKDQLN